MTTTTTSTTSTTTSSAGSAVITALGSASGIDMSALATNLAAAQFLSRSSQLDSQATKLQTQISDASALKSQLLTLAQSIGNRVRAGDLAAVPSVANSAVATATAGTGGGGSGTYSLEVSTLASAQVLSSPSYASAATTVGAGTLTLRFGTISGTTFTEDTAHPSVDITIAAGAKLSDVAAAINGKNAGVTAYVASGANGAQLVLKGAEGASNAFVLDAAEDPANPGLSALAWSPSGDAARVVSKAGNAAFKLDGIAMTNASNTLTDIAPGLSMTLAGTNVGNPTRITFSDPSSQIGTVMSDLAGALNEIVSALASDTDPNTGSLNSDPGARTLRQALSSLPGKVVMPNAPDGAPRTLGDLGLRINRDGTFDVDTARLDNTIKASPAGAAAMFTTGFYGVYSTFDNLSRSLTSISDPGSIGASITRYTAKQTTVNDAKSKIADQQEAMRQRLVTQFAHTDSVVGGYKSTLTFIQAQIAAWNAKSN